MSSCVSAFTTLLSRLPEASVGLQFHDAVTFKYSMLRHRKSTHLFLVLGPEEHPSCRCLYEQYYKFRARSCFKRDVGVWREGWEEDEIGSVAYACVMCCVTQSTLEPVSLV